METFPLYLYIPSPFLGSFHKILDDNIDSSLSSTQLTVDQ